MKGSLAGVRPTSGWAAARIVPAAGPTAARLLEGVLALAIFALALTTRAINLDDRAVYPQGDEGIRGAQLLLMQAGFRPLGEIYAAQGPLLLDLLYPLYTLFGGGLVGARLAVGAYSLLSLLGVYWIARQAGGPLGGLAAALLLAFSPTYLDNSRQALAEAVALGPAVLAVGAALAYGRRGGRGWLVASGALLGISLLIKPITVSAALPVGLVIFGRARRGPRDLLLVGLVTAAVVLGGLLLVGLGGVLDQIVEYRLRARETQAWRLAGNWEVLQRPLSRESLALYGLALLGSLALLRLAPAAGVPLTSWALGAGLLLLLYSPLFEKHATTLLPPLAALAGAGVGRCWPARATAPAGRALLLIPLAWYAWSLPGLLKTDRELIALTPPDDGFRQSIAADQVRGIAALAGPGDYVLTDYPTLAFLAGRLVPPPLADASDTRVRAQELSGPELIEAVTTYPAAVAVLRTQRFRSLSGFSSWFGQHYLLVKTYGQDKEVKEQRVARYVYLRRDADLAAARAALVTPFDRRADADFGGVLRLGAYAQDTTALAPGESALLSLEWEATAPLRVDYQISLRLLGENGRTWEVDRDSLRDPRDDDADWQAGRWVVQAATLSLPPRLPRGQYQLLVSVYEPKGDRPLPATSAGTHAPVAERGVVLGTITVR